MESLFRGLIRLRYPILIGLLGCTVVLGLQMNHLRFESDAESMVPPDDPVQRYNDLVEDRFGIRDLIIVGVLNDNPQENGVFNPRTLGVVKEFSERLALLPGIKAVRNEDVTSVATMDNITGTADGLAVDPFMKEVPQTPEELVALKNSLFSNPMYVDWLVSRDGTGLLIMAKMEPSQGTREGVARRAAIYNTIRQMIQAKKDAGFPEQFHVAGRGAIEVTFSEDASRDMAKFMPLVLLIVLGALYLSYRSLRGVVLPFLVVIPSVIWTLGIMAMVGVPMYFISTMMPVILLANAVAYGIHILNRYYDELLTHPGTSATEAVVAAMCEMWLPVTFAALTTVAGFLSFLTASMLPLRHFGVFTAVGIFVALIFALTFLPAVLVMLPPTVSRSLRRQMGRSDDLSASGWTARMLARLGRGVARRPLWVWAPTVLLMGVCLAGVQRIEVDTSWIRSFHPQSPVRIADEVLRDKFQGTLPTYVAIEGHAPDLLKDPDLLQKLDRLQAEIEKDPSVGGSLSIAEFLKRMNRVMNEDRLEMEVVPTSRDLVSQYLLLYSFSGDPDDFDEVVDYDYQHANVAFYLRSDSTQDILRVVHQIQDFAVREFGRATQSGGEDGQVPDPWSLRFGRWLSGVEPTIIGWETNSGFRIGFAGPGYFSHRFSELVVAGQISSLVASLVTVFLLTAIMFRSLTAGVINCIPISLVMIFGFGLMGLLNIPLEVGRSLTASMVIGSGIDYTIHFLNKYRVKVREGLTTPEDITVATMVTSGKAIFFNAVVVIGGYLVFLTSNFSPNFALGAMVALNMSACLLASMTVLPAVLNTFKPRFVYGMEKPAPLAVNPEYEA
jgi:hypothetical protein